MQQLLAALLGLFLTASAQAQPTHEFRARLSPVPIDLAMQNVIAGSGTVTAVLTGTTLTVNGKFTGLKSPATAARIHVGAKGIRGPAALDLELSRSTSGTITGRFSLTPQQVSELSTSRFYIQLHSEKAADGNLWGWLLPKQ